MARPKQKTITKTNTKTNTKTITMTKTNTFRELHQTAIPDACDLWDIWSEWWGDKTWPKKRQIQRQIQRQWKRQTKGLVTFETLITILKIENLDSWQSLLPDNQEWHWTAFAILTMFWVIGLKFKQKPEVLLHQMANLSYSPSTSYHFREACPFDSTASDGMFCP